MTKRIFINTLLLFVSIWLSTSASVYAQDDPSVDGDGATTIEDVNLPTEEGEEASENNLPALANRSELIVDATLATSLSFIPSPKRVINTAYIFRVNEVITGQTNKEYIVVYDTGGVLADGLSMDTVESFRLFDGERYIVVTDLVDDEYWIDNVFQLVQDNNIVADASGRVVVGVDEGEVITQPQKTEKELRYIVAPDVEQTQMESGPTSGSLPLPMETPVAFSLDEAEPITPSQIKDFLRSASQNTLEESSIAPTMNEESNQDGSDDSDAEPAPANAGEQSDAEEAPSVSEDPQSDAEETPSVSEDSQSDAASGEAEPIVGSDQLSGNHVTRYQSHYYYMPDDDNWEWSIASRGSWNVLAESVNGFNLFAYKIDSDGDPIRNRLPVAGDRNYNVGVLTSAQMANGGYDSWADRPANGRAYRWRDSNNRLIEADVLVNPAIANDEAQFRKTLTHEFGHAFTLLHEDKFMALLFPGTFRQPPNYASNWYSRFDDHRGIRTMLQWVNDNVAAGSWTISQFSDMATWSQAHSNPGSVGSLVMTSIAGTTLNQNAIVQMRNVHVENRGNQPAQNVNLKFYLSTNNIITSRDIEIASYTWSTFNTYWSGNLNVQIPADTPNGTYHVGWILTTDSSERSSANNTALLLNSHTSDFSEVTVTVQ